jgi:hypothetical protein
MKLGGMTDLIHSIGLRVELTDSMKNANHSRKKRLVRQAKEIE